MGYLGVVLRGGCTQPPRPLPDPKVTTMSTLTVQTPDASCGSCETHITEAAETLPGVTAVAVDLDTRVTTVTYDGDQVDADRIEAALAEAGYPTKPVDA
jgi:copper chaperone